MKAAFLAALRQYYALTYRDLAASEYTKWLGLEGIHYTTIHKAIKRLQYKELGYEGWAKKTGYFRKRCSEEHTFSMLVTKYGEKISSHTERMAERDIFSMLILHNLHTTLYLHALSRRNPHKSKHGQGESQKAKIAS